MAVKYIILIFIWIHIINAQENCCKGKENIIVKGKCIDGSNITGIQCQRKYLIEDFEDQNLSINSDGVLMDGDEIILVDRYCLTKNSSTGKKMALACFPELSSSNDWSLFTFKACCVAISIVFLILTCIVYILVPDLRDLQGKCLLHSIAALTLALFLLCLLQFGITLSDNACHAIGYITYISFFATFTWLNTVAFHIWRTTVLTSTLGTNKQWYFLYCVYAYGIAIIVVIAAIIAHHAPGDHIKPRIGEYTCWFANAESAWAYFYGPIAFFLVLNIIFFVWTIKKLWTDVGNEQCSTSKLKVLRYKCLLHVKLYIVMGISWIFEVLSFAFNDEESDNFMHYIWIIIDFINALQGVLIFLVLVVFRKRAIRGLAQRGLYCIQLPSQWKTLEDEECEDLIEERQLNQDSVPVEQLRKENEKNLV